MQTSGGNVVLLALVLVLALVANTSSVSALTSLGGSVTVADFQYHVSLDDNNFQLFYNLEPTGSFHACIEGRTTGWVGLGFGNLGQDFIAGYFTTVVEGGDYSVHPGIVLDASQDTSLLSGADNGVITTLCFRRLFDTGDADDVVIRPYSTSAVRVNWARGPPGDPTSPANLQSHLTGTTPLQYGAQQLVWTADPQPTPAFTGVINPLAFDYAIYFSWNRFHAFFNLLDDGTFNMCIEAQTTGWLGIGWGSAGTDYVAGFHGGTGPATRIGDYTNHDSIVLDVDQDITITGGGEAGGATTLCFQRLLAPIDSDDAVVSITNRMRWSWAYGPTDPTTGTISGTYTTHGTATRGAGMLIASQHEAPVVPIGGLVTASDYRFSMAVERNVYNLWWHVLPVNPAPGMLPTTLEMCIEGRGTGWVGIGFGSPTGQDLVVGYRSGVTNYVSDYAGHTTLVEDASVDATLTTPNGAEIAGVTTICFDRKLNTADPDDVVLPVAEEITAQWGLSTTDPASLADVPAVTHTQRGSFAFTLDPTRSLPTAVAPSTLPPWAAIAIVSGAVLVVAVVSGAVLRTRIENRLRARDAAVVAMIADSPDAHVLGDLKKDKVSELVESKEAADIKSSSVKQPPRGLRKLGATMDESAIASVKRSTGGRNPEAGYGSAKRSNNAEAGYESAKRSNGARNSTNQAVYGSVIRKESEDRQSNSSEAISGHDNDDINSVVAAASRESQQTPTTASLDAGYRSTNRKNAPAAAPVSSYSQASQTVSEQSYGSAYGSGIKHGSGGDSGLQAPATRPGRTGSGGRPSASTARGSAGQRKAKRSIGSRGRAASGGGGGGGGQGNSAGSRGRAANRGGRGGRGGRSGRGQGNSLGSRGRAATSGGQSNSLGSRGRAASRGGRGKASSIGSRGRSGTAGNTTGSMARRNAGRKGSGTRGRKVQRSVSPMADERPISGFSGTSLAPPE